MARFKLDGRETRGRTSLDYEGITVNRGVNDTNPVDQFYQFMLTKFARKSEHRKPKETLLKIINQRLSLLNEPGQLREGRHYVIWPRYEDVELEKQLEQLRKDYPELVFVTLVGDYTEEEYAAGEYLHQFLDPLGHLNEVYR